MRSLYRLLLAMVPAISASAQDTGVCGDGTPQPFRIAHGFAVNPLAAFERAGEVTVLGWPAYQTDKPRPGAARVVDSLFAGVLIRDSSPPERIPLPLPGRAFEEPYVLRVTQRGAEILFHVPRPQPRNDLRPDSIEIWSGHLAGAHWSGLQRLATVDGHPLMGTQLVADVWRTDGEVEYAFGGRDSLSSVDGLFTLRNAFGRWSLERDTLRLSKVLYVDVARLRSGWTQALIGSPRRIGARGGGWEMALLVATRTENGWSSYSTVAVVGDAWVTEPRLVQGADGEYLAWLDMSRPGARMLRAQSLGDPRPNDALTRVVVGRITAGTTPWRDVLAIATHPDTGVLTMPSAAGWRDLLSLPISMGVPPLLVSGDGGPIAVTLTPDPLDSEVEVIHLFDLRCALGGPRPFP